MSNFWDEQFLLGFERSGESGFQSALLAILDGFGFSDHASSTRILLISSDQLKPVRVVLPGRAPALLPK